MKPGPTRSGWASGRALAVTRGVKALFSVSRVLDDVPTVATDDAARIGAGQALLRGSQDWLLGHAFQLMAGIALALGAYLTVSGLVRLS